MTDKSIWESKIFWVNVLSGLVMVFSAIEIIAILPVTVLPYVAAGVAVLNIILRFITNTAVHL